MPFPTGLSSQAIHGSGNHHPWDPSDLLRCINYCDGYLTTEQLRERMSGRSVAWDRLLPEWDHLVALLRHEMSTRTDHRAPLTYREMKRVLADGGKCVPCDSTGRGAICEKCKGSGRRGGGHCRARNCYQGADFCANCRGNGYTKKEGA